MGIPNSEITRLVALGAPVVCLDTCSILDVMRDPTRESVRPHDARAILDLLAKMETGTELVSLVAEQVHFEFNEHAPRVQGEAEQALKRLQEQLKRIDSIAAVFGASTKADLLHLDPHVARARAVVDRIIAASTSAPAAPDIASRALTRLNQARTPARKGKDSMKDCVVVETYLDAVAKLRAGGLMSKVVFTSSNTKDYAGETGVRLRPDLGCEFAALGIEYASNHGEAKHLLGL